MIKLTPPKKQIPFYFNRILPELDMDLYEAKYPSDYLAFIEFYGEGIMGDFIRIFPPEVAEVIEPRWKKGYGKYIQDTHFDGKPFLNTVVLIGDSLDCDSIFYWEGNYYVFSAEGDDGFFENVGPGLGGVIEFYKSGKYWESIDMNSFTPFNYRWVFNGLIGYESFFGREI